jgi:hypothetical protein
LKVPKKIKAFGREYQIIRDNHITDKIEVWGYLDLFRDEIVLKKRTEEFTVGHEKQVFMHELIHLIDDNLKICLSEDQTQSLAVGLVTVMCENKLDFNDVL